MDSIFNTVKNVFSQISTNNNNNNKHHTNTNQSNQLNNNMNHKVNNNVNRKVNNNLHKNNNLRNLRGGYIRKNTLRKRKNSVVNLKLKTRNKGKLKRSKSVTSLKPSKPIKKSKSLKKVK